MAFRGQKRFWTVILTIETKKQCKNIHTTSMQLTTFQLCFLSLIVLRSLYLHVLAHLSHRLIVSYHNGWMSVVNKLLQRTSSPKLLAVFYQILHGWLLYDPNQ